MNGTLEEARAMAADAIGGYLENLQKHGDEIPVEHDRSHAAYRRQPRPRMSRLPSFSSPV